MRRVIFVFLLLSMLFVVTVPVAWAASPRAEVCPDGPFDENGEPRSLSQCKCTYADIGDETYCLSGEESLAATIRDMIRLWLISAARGIASFFWLLIRLAAIICDALLRGEIWDGLRDAILGQLETILGGRDGILYQIIGPSNGLFAVALMLAGLVMTVPLLGAQTTRLVQLERVIPWGLLVLALFVTSSAGFDLIAAIEGLRVSMVQTIAGVGADGSSNLISLVAAPMQATPEETLRLDAQGLWQLPSGFERTYFPQPEYITRRVVITNLTGDVLDLVFRGEIMESASYARMTARAGEALFRILIGTVSLYVLVLVAMNYLLLFAAALALIIYLLATLPLGFFEFGGALHLKILTQYIAVVGLSLFVAVLVSILTATTLLTMESFDFGNLATYFVTHLIVAVLLTMAFDQSWKVMDGSIGMIQQSVGMVGALAVSTSGPVTGSIEAGKKAASTAATAVTAAAVGFATGGAAGALMGGIGGLMSNSSAGTQAADTLSSQAPDNQAVQSFAVGARSGGSPLQAVASGLVAARRPFAKLDGESAEQGQMDAVYYPAPLDPKWKAVEQGDHLAADLGALEKAEAAYFRDLDAPTARTHLRATFGSDAVADEVMGVYSEQGPTGARWVRGVSEAAQIAADETRNAGLPVFTAAGRPSSAYQTRLETELSERRLADNSSASFPTAQRIAGAAIRQPQSVWQQPARAAHLLTCATLDPERGEVQMEDVSAQYALRDLALHEGWDRPENQPKLEAVFHAYHHIRQDTPPENIQAEQVYAALRQDPQLANERPEALHEAARLVTLAGDSAWVQHGPESPQRQVFVRQEDGGDLAFSMPYSGDLNQRLFDDIPAESRSWDAETREWHVEEAYAETARQMVQDVADEHGWTVRQEGDGGGEASIEETPTPIPADQLEWERTLDEVGFVEPRIMTDGEPAPVAEATVEIPALGNELPTVSEIQPETPAARPEPPPIIPTPPRTSVVPATSPSNPVIQAQRRGPAPSRKP